MSGLDMMLALIVFCFIWSPEWLGERIGRTVKAYKEATK